TPESAQIVQGGSCQFSAVVTGLDNKNVAWMLTGNASTSTVIDSAGKLTVAKDETAHTLTVKAYCAADFSIYKEVSVIVLIPEKPSITITPENAEIMLGGSRQFSAAVTGMDNKKVIWTVLGNKSPSTVIDSSGKLTVATDETSANLTVRVYCAEDSSIYKDAGVIVLIPAKPHIVIYPVSTQIKHGASRQFSAAVSGTDYKNVVWRVSGNKSPSTVINSAGNLTVAKDETATTLMVRAYCAADLSVYDEASVTVLPPDNPAISIAPVTVQIVHGGSYQFSAAVSGTDNKKVLWTVIGNQSPSTVIDSTGRLVVATNETAAYLTVRAACTVDPSVYAQVAFSVKKRITSFNPLKTSVLYQYVVKGTPVTSLKLPLELNAVVDGKSDTPVKILKWVSKTAYNPDNPASYYFTPVPDSEYLMETGVILPVIQIVVYAKGSNNSHSGGSSHGGGGSHSGGGSGASASVTQSSVAVSNTVGTTTVSVIAQTDSSPTVVDHRVSVSMQATFNFTAAENNATVQNHSRVEIILPSSVFIDQIHNKDINSVDMTIKIPSMAVFHSDSKVDLSMELSSDVLQAAQLSGKEVIVEVADDTTGKKNYSWTFRGEDLKNSQPALQNINMALNIKSSDSDAAVSRLIPNSIKGALLTFANNGVLPAPAAVSAYVADQGFKAGQNLYLYYYNPAGGLEAADYPACRVDENGYANIVISHCSQYVLLPGQVAPNASVTLDTGKTLKVKEGKSYQFRVTAPARPKLTCGNPSAFKVTACGSKGNHYYFKAIAVGKAGKTAGFYVNGEKTPRTVATIIK
ncbi:MAG TPA: hypothetical protein VHP54_01510, partial [Caproiciproducens sp.]|nr:hypothetical protein [Caproiciproducens sp.]